MAAKIAGGATLKSFPAFPFKLQVLSQFRVFTRVYSRSPLLCPRYKFLLMNVFPEIYSFGLLAVKACISWPLWRLT
jgi:hypothetical protein